MKTITGTWLHADGTPAAGGLLTLLLSQDANLSAGGGQVEKAAIAITLDSTGSIPAGTQILANDELLPSGTFYHVIVTDSTFGTSYRERLTIAGNSPINLNSLVPTNTP